MIFFSLPHLIPPSFFYSIIFNRSKLMANNQNKPIQNSTDQSQSIQNLISMSIHQEFRNARTQFQKNCPKQIFQISTSQLNVVKLGKSISNKNIPSQFLELKITIKSNFINSIFKMKNPPIKGNSSNAKYPRFTIH